MNTGPSRPSEFKFLKEELIFILTLLEYESAKWAHGSGVRVQVSMTEIHIKTFNNIVKIFLMFLDILIFAHGNECFKWLRETIKHLPK